MPTQIQNQTLPASDRTRLRELAHRYFEASQLEIMAERRRRWFDHNALKPGKPMLVMETTSFMEEYTPRLECRSEMGREIETGLLMPLISHEEIGDDKVISNEFQVDWKIHFTPFGGTMAKHHARDSEGRMLGYDMDHPIKDLVTDLPQVKPSTFSVDREGTREFKSVVEDVIGDIVPVTIGNGSLNWHLVISRHVIELMAVEELMYALIDSPDEVKALYRFVTDDIIAFLDWQQEEGLLVVNNGNEVAGAGSYGFTDELPAWHADTDVPVTTRDLWANFNAQSVIGISPAMYGEFLFPFYRELAQRFGLVYYGCCEPVHPIWDDFIRHLPGLRKVSISAWCDEAFMGERLRDRSVIYSRKPFPNFIGVGSRLDEAAYREHMATTLNAARGCQLEIIYRDIYTLGGDLTKPVRAIQIARELIESMW